MKLNVKGLVFVGFAAAIFAGAANAGTIPEGETAQKKTVTSVKFTEDTYQKKLTATSPISISNDNVISTTAEANVIEGVTFNGADATITNKKAVVNAITGVNDSNSQPLTVTNGVVTLPAATAPGDGTLTITVDGTDTTFTANQSGNSSVSVSVPVKAIKVAGADSNLTVGAGGVVTIPADTNTTYSAGTGLTLTGTEFSLSGDGDTTAYTGTGAIDVTNHVISTTAQANVLEKVKVDGTALTIDTTDKSVDLGQAAAKDVDTSITAGSTSTDVPTTAAVASFVGSQPGATAYTGTGLISVNDHTISTTAQANVIETVKVNGTALTVTDKAVDVTVPAQVQSDWNATTGLGVILNKPAFDLPAVPSGTTCNATSPCALVLAGSTPTWEPIQQ